MPEAATLALAFAGAFGAALVSVPLAIRLAWRTSFLDRPVDYKQHGGATPYLGGAAVVAAFLPVALLVLGGEPARVWWIVGGALLLCAVGTFDDRVNLGPLPRLAIEAGVGAALWGVGLGWYALGSDVAGLALTIFWVVGLVNAFNLMDNLDGATGTVGMVCAAGAAGAVVSNSGFALAAVALALSGSCAGFLTQNLKRPARIFLGDGGSMPIGFVVAAVTMFAFRDPNGPSAIAVVAAAPMAGLAILDTTLVMVSRARRGVPLLSGGRDHVTHRLLRVLGTPQRVALVLGTVQACLCGLAVGLLQASWTAVATAGFLYIAVGAATILFLDRSPAFQPEWSQAPRRPQRLAASDAAILQAAAQQESSS